MNYLHVFDTLIKSRFVAVIRCDSKEQAMNTSQICIEAGFQALEITLTTPGALDVIEQLSIEHPEIMIGAGSVLDAESARLAMLKGAQFVVGPNFNKDLSRLANRYQVPYFPGCMTINEMIEALESGVHLIKLFPANELVKRVTGIKGPLPQIEFMATGGIDLDNAGDYFKQGVLVCGIGSSINKLIQKHSREEAVKTLREGIRQYE